MDWFQAQRQCRERNHDRLMAQAAEGWPPWRPQLRRLALRFEAWLRSDESELDWSADDALENGQFGTQSTGEK